MWKWKRKPAVITVNLAQYTRNEPIHLEKSEGPFQETILQTILYRRAQL